MTKNRCLNCGTTACEKSGTYDREVCVLVAEVMRAGSALDAWHDGAIAGALLAGVELDVWESNLHKRYDDAKLALGQKLAVNYEKGR